MDIQKEKSLSFFSFFFFLHPPDKFYHLSFRLRDCSRLSEIVNLNYKLNQLKEME